VKIKCLDQEHNTMNSVKHGPRSLDHSGPRSHDLFPSLEKRPWEGGCPRALTVKTQGMLAKSVVSILLSYVLSNKF